MAMQALVMGFGGTGAHILTALKELTVLKHGKKPDSVKFLLFDTIADWEPGKGVPTLIDAAEEKIAEGTEAATSLDKYTEYFQLSDHDPDLKKYVFEYLGRGGEPDKYPHLKNWLHAPWLSKYIPEARLNVTEGAAQQRHIGRFVMFQNSEKIVEKLRGYISELSQKASGTGVNVWIIGSSAGGTGAGCLLDAGFMVRLAARQAGDIDINLTGVIILPQIFSGIAGISMARAYSLMRELNRVQQQDIPESDRYTKDAGTVSTQVDYDAREQNRVLVRGKLFDDLFYLGKECKKDEERKSFYSSVANAIDPYLDAKSGPVLLQASVNSSDVAASFGASRLYVPNETLVHLFAWEQVEDYLKKATAPVVSGNQITDIHYGADSDRQDNAGEKTKNLLNLFGEILQRAGKTEKENSSWVKNSLDPEKIVTGWYQFAASSLAGEKLSLTESQDVMLAYINPYKSFNQTEEDKIDPQELETKTYNENKAVKGVKESYEESRDRFAKRLDDLTNVYTNIGGGNRTFMKGRRLVKDKVTNRLRKKIDELIINELKQNQTFAVDPDNREQGTPLTRIYREINHIIGIYLKQIDGTIAQFIETMQKDRGDLEQKPIEALRELSASKKTGFIQFGNWVEPYQKAAREEFFEYIRWYQKYNLLQDMQEIVRSVSDHFSRWRIVLKNMFDELSQNGNSSALFRIKLDKIEALNQRIYRASRNPTAKISLQENDETMSGYINQLRNSATGASSGETLAEKKLAESVWETGIDSRGNPELRLIVENLNKEQKTYKNDYIKNVVEDLQNHFQEEIRQRLKNTDIFDYLLYLQKSAGVEGSKIIEKLRGSAESLLTATGTEESRLIYSDPLGVDKTELAAELQKNLKVLDSGAKDPERGHSDSNSITLLKVKKPNLNEIEDIKNCENEYKAELSLKPKVPAQVKRIQFAQVYHPFRAELEAWHIERLHWRSEDQSPNTLMPARIVRLLENPEMMQAFVQSIATGAIKKNGYDWVWEHTEPRKLTNYDLDGDKADLMSAAITFILRQRVIGLLQDITYRDAQKSIAKAG